MQTWALVVDSFRDARDRKIFWVMITISVVMAATMACISFTPTGVDVLFGTWTLESSVMSLDADGFRAAIGALVIKIIADPYLGWLGIILALVSTAATFPALMESGAIDIVLSKPISRHKVFLSKYLGAMVFVLLQSAVFVGLTFLVIGIRWHCWLPGYLWLIPLMVLLFSYLFAFTAFFSILTGKAMSALMFTMLAWVLIWAPQEAYGVILTMEESEHTRRWERIAAVTKWIVPKTQDIPLIAGKLVGAGLVTDSFFPDTEDLNSQIEQDIQDARRAENRVTDELQPVVSIATSLLFEAIIVALAMWRFKRTDF